jgi:hypothetical protein
VRAPVPLPLALCLALAAPAFASDPAPAGLLEPAFGNTIVTTYPDGRIGKLWLNRDGSWTSEGRHHNGSVGRWTLNGRKLCLKRQKPWAPFSWCTHVPDGGVGTSWKDRAPTGEPVTITVVAGREGEGARR